MSAMPSLPTTGTGSTPNTHPDAGTPEASGTPTSHGKQEASGTPTSREKRIWPLSKWQAFGLHAVLSVLVFGSLVAVMLIWWFPGELFIVDGGWEGLKLVAMVDLVLGPALTLLLYKPGKPKLVMDMSMIAVFQIVALAYGFYTTHQQRTLAVVHAEGAFVTLSAAALETADEKLRQFEETPRSLATFAPGHPRMLINPPAVTSDAFGKYLEQLLNGYPQAHERSDQLVELADNLDMLKGSVKSLDKLTSPGTRKTVEAAMASTGRPASELELHDFNARYANGIAIFDPKSMTILDYVVIADGDAAELAEGSQ